MSFVDIQNQFMAHIRDPKSNQPIAGIEDRRLNIYRELFFNNIEGFVSSAYPVLKSLIDEDSWLKLIRSFFANHNCSSPYFLDISEEFLSYLLDKTDFEGIALPFMHELAHYEWIELKIATASEDRERQHNGELTEHAHLSISNAATVLSYQFPVQHIKPDFQPEKASGEPTYLVVFRDSDDEVKFLQVNGLTAAMLNLIQENPDITLMQLQDQLSQMFTQIQPDILNKGAHDTIIDLIKKTILFVKN